MMPRQLEDPLYRCYCILRRRRASRPDANHIRFVLDYQAWQRAEPGADRDEIIRFSRPPHLGLEDASEWAHWDLPLRAMIETLNKRFPEVADSEATIPKLVPELWLERYVWINAEYRSAAQQLQRYLLLVQPLGEPTRLPLGPSPSSWIQAMRNGQSHPARDTLLARSSSRASPRGSCRRHTCCTTLGRKTRTQLT